MLLAPPLPEEEIDRLGAEWYAKIRPMIETPENIGRQVTINVQTGDYEIHSDRDAITASRRLHEKDPDAPLFGFRIGYNAVYSLGGLLRPTPRP